MGTVHLFRGYPTAYRTSAARAVKYGFQGTARRSVGRAALSAARTRIPSMAEHIAAAEAFSALRASAMRRAFGGLPGLGLSALEYLIERELEASRQNAMVPWSKGKRMYDFTGWDTVCGGGQDGTPVHWGGSAHFAPGCNPNLTWEYPIGENPDSSFNLVEGPYWPHPSPPNGAGQAEVAFVKDPHPATGNFWQGQITAAYKLYMWAVPFQGLEGWDAYYARNGENLPEIVTPGVTLPAIVPKVAPMIDPWFLPITQPAAVPLPVPYPIIPKVPEENPLRSPVEQPQRGPAPLSRGSVRDAAAGPTITIEAHGNDAVQTVRAGSPRRRPPRRREKEKKFVATSRGLAVRVIFDGISEVADFVDAIWSALPYQYRFGNRRYAPGMLPRKTLQAKMADIYNGFDHVNWNRALMGVVRNELSDRLFGMAGRGYAQAAGVNPYYTRAVGYQTGPAL